MKMEFWILQMSLSGDATFLFRRGVGALAEVEDFFFFKSFLKNFARLGICPDLT